MEKVQWNSIDKKQNGLKYSKNDKSSASVKQVSLLQVWSTAVGKNYFFVQTRIEQK